MSTAELATLVKDLQRQVQENAAQVARLAALLDKKDQEISLSQKQIAQLEAEVKRATTTGVAPPVFEAEAPTPEPGSQFGLLAGVATGPYNQDWGYMSRWLLRLRPHPQRRLG